MSQEEIINQLEQKVQALSSLVENQNKTIEELTIEVKALSVLNARLQKLTNADKTRACDLLEMLRKNFRSSTEQLELFDDIENTATLGALEETPEGNEVNRVYYPGSKDLDEDL